MPVVTNPAPHRASIFSKSRDLATSAQELLQGSCPQEFRSCESILQSSFSHIGSGSTTDSSPNGFVYAAVQAYNHHHHLVIRPEDVWFSILTQLSLFINAHAKDVRSAFVAHQGQKDLEVMSDTPDFDRLAKAMTLKLEKNIVDPSLRKWIMPNFTTTTDTDKVVASVIMMGSLQKYFNYKISIRCGLPSVTLLGDKADWESILTKIERIPQLGSGTADWYQQLKPVITHFVGTFDSPDSSETKEFWQKIAHYSGGGSGPTYLSGWITAFCFWGETGKSPCGTSGGCGSPAPALILDDVAYSRIDTEDIPPGFTSVPVKVDDNGDEYDAVMIAGLVGIKVTSSGDPSAPVRQWWYGRGTEVEEPIFGLDTLQPESGWWIFRKGEDKQANCELPPY
ncbi:MAG: hypothetical protein M1840_009178 [Geoglossum simile]|nr:MAG: hypothetical protein M1840_009178 [Geoglossum simile]